MKLRAKFTVLSIISLGFLLSANPATALTAAELQDVQVIGHHFTTEISTGSKRLFLKDASKGRYIVLKLTATVQEDGKIFTNDFALRYFHSGGKEDRAECEAIASAETAEIGKFGKYFTGNAAWMRLDNGQVYFGLVFFIEQDVNTIDIHRIGIVEPLTYRIGSDRLYSVYVTSNSATEILGAAEEVIGKGGYYVNTSQGLNEEETGVTIHYRAQAESQAREISQRLMMKLEVVPTLKKMAMISEFDIVVWLGK